jgi:hypothetical protein
MSARNEMSAEYRQAFVGLTITGHGESEDGFPFLLGQYPPDSKGSMKVKVEISQDPEGNGPGFLFLADMGNEPVAPKVVEP